jgi:hypothetical protein
VVINIIFRKLIIWPFGNKMDTIMQGFITFCGLPNIQWAINGTHFSISNPIGPYCEDYFNHKIGGYNVVCQVVFDDK